MKGLNSTAKVAKVERRPLWCGSNNAAAAAYGRKSPFFLSRRWFKGGRLVRSRHVRWSQNSTKDVRSKVVRGEYERERESGGILVLGKGLDFGTRLGRGRAEVPEAACYTTLKETDCSTGECIHLRRCYSPCGVRDDPGGGGARQPRVGGDGEAEHAVQLHLQTEEKTTHKAKVVTRDKRGLEV